ncbi:hypothetical protein GCM10018781_43660 [Kitasatospora indigofera]|uniref:Uncharacterized protein n=1 Tax=Kitasatospora indigofera TaxID=67307 RepID=A0A919KWI6_9ACTN|nr:hypothetical protein GCM10018781_43660 [Kitasatospora indigofera]
MQAECRAQDHAQHLTDRAAGEAVQGGLHRRAPTAVPGGTVTGVAGVGTVAGMGLTAALGAVPAVGGVRSSGAVGAGCVVRGVCHVVLRRY